MHSLTYLLPGVVVVLLVCVLRLDVCCAQEASDQFNIRPGFDETVSISLDEPKVTAKFSYSCNGGIELR